MSTDSTFFISKRRWSEIKDRILGAYLKPYLAKVGTLGKRIVLVDGFAGQGLFGEGENQRQGSPLIMTRLAEEMVPGRYTAHFANKNRVHHRALVRALRPWIESGSDLRVVNGTAASLLSQVRQDLTDQILFVYLDPFGLKGCSFDMILPFLRRSRSYSTELLINVSTKTLHRLAAAKSTPTGRGQVLRGSWHGILTQVLGGEYWREIMLDDSLPANEKERQVMDQYTTLLSEYLPFTGYCPVKETPNGPTKYYLAFCSRHPDTLELMNDIMAKAYGEFMHNALYGGTLLEHLPWTDIPWDWRTDLRPILLEKVRHYQGCSRSGLWIHILKDHFRTWTSSEYRQCVKDLVQGHHLRFESQTGRLNDQAKLFTV